MEYSEPVRRRFEQPRRLGPLSGRAGFCVAGSAGSERDGMRIWLGARIVDGTIEEAAFRAYGCPQTVAVADWAAEQIEGQALQELAIDPLGASDALRIWPEKLSCALCAEDAVRALGANWKAISQSKAIGSFELERGTS